MVDPLPLAGLRVALVLGSSAGGIGRHVAHLAGGLAQRGAAVTVCGPRATEVRFAFTAAGAAYRPLEIPAGPHPADLAALARLHRLLATAGIADVAHAHGLRAGALAGLAGRRGRPPLVVTWHNAALGGGATRRVHGALERLVARRADVTLGASADLVERAVALGARDARLGPVTAPPLPAARGAAADVRARLAGPGRPLVVAIGRLHPQKRIDVLIDAAARWGNGPGAPLAVVAGDGPLRAELQRRIDATGAAVRLLGHRDDVAELLAAADVVALPSEWEARSLVAQEALRAGRPLVTTAVGGLPGLVGDAAVLVPPGDPAALADAVVRVLTEPGLAARLAERGPRLAAGWPSEQEAVDAVVAAYVSALRGRR